ncbi:MAG: hypothetical protein AAGF93_18045 [Cyanobacteria bacterium P01_H01_bin.105]
MKIWVARYFPDLSTLAIGDGATTRGSLYTAASQQGRIATANKLNKHLIETECSLAAVRAREMYSYHSASSFKEAANLAKFTSRIYLKLIEVYQDSTTVVSSSRITSEQPLETFSLEAWGLPKTGNFARELAPFLSDLKERHRITKNWQSVGFMTTQIGLSNALLLEKLTSTEQVFINCYFRFLEEQVAIPWRRLFSAANSHQPASPIFGIVETMLPLTTEISTIVYECWSKLFPNYVSRRGRFSDPGIKHSSIRDFDMFQTYLWLCLLEGDMAFIEQELLTICIIVFSALNIPWDMTVKGVLLLACEILSRLKLSQKKIVEPYVESMVRSFSRAKLSSQI